MKAIELTDYGGFDSLRLTDTEQPKPSANEIFDPLTRCGCHEWIRRVLCFPRNLVVPELHNTRGVGWLAVVGQDDFGDPKITAANYSSHSKPLFVRLTSALVLYVASATGSLAWLRVVQHSVLEIDAVLRFNSPNATASAWNRKIQACVSKSPRMTEARDKSIAELTKCQEY